MTIIGHSLMFLFSLKGSNEEIPNLIYFDKHDDAKHTKCLQEILSFMEIDSISEITERKLWDFTEFGLSGMDDDWLRAGMILGLINNSIVIGKEDNTNILKDHETFLSEDGFTHKLHAIPHLDEAMAEHSCLSDMVIVHPWYEEVRNILGIYPEGNLFKFNKPASFILDFDLDCFTDVIANKRIAWPEKIFKSRYCEDNYTGALMYHLVENAQFITICREPEYCGGIGESSKILTYLDKYLFRGVINSIGV